MIIRNDDVSSDTTMEDIKWFCELCDEYGVKPLQAITLNGDTHDIDIKMTNEEIRKRCTCVEDNTELIDYLLQRNDLIGVHGLWHTHSPSEEEIDEAKERLINMGFNPTYFVTPFNEGNYQDSICGLKVSQLTQRLEDYLHEGKPIDEIAYLHSWRFGDWYPKKDLELCLKRLTTAS